MDEGFRTFEHTGDLGLEVWAGSPERLYALAVVALQAQIAEIPEGAAIGPGAREVKHQLVLEGADPAELLVHWLNTSLLEAEIAQAVWTAADVHTLTPRRIEGALAGPRRDRARQVFLREVKAVSHHALELDLVPGRCRCRLILDI